MRSSVPDGMQQTNTQVPPSRNAQQALRALGIQPHTSMARPDVRARILSLFTCTGQDAMRLCAPGVCSCPQCRTVQIRPPCRHAQAGPRSRPRRATPLASARSGRAQPLPRATLRPPCRAPVEWGRRHGCLEALQHPRRRLLHPLWLAPARCSSGGAQGPCAPSALTGTAPGKRGALPASAAVPVPHALRQLPASGQRHSLELVPGTLAASAPALHSTGGSAATSSAWSCISAASLSELRAYSGLSPSSHQLGVLPGACRRLRSCPATTGELQLPAGSAASRAGYYLQEGCSKRERANFLPADAGPPQGCSTVSWKKAGRTCSWR